MFYENLDLDNIVTPVKVDILIKMLKDSGYDPGEIQYLESGFS